MGQEKKVQLIDIESYFNFYWCILDIFTHDNEYHCGATHEKVIATMRKNGVCVYKESTECNECRRPKNSGEIWPIYDSFFFLLCLNDNHQLLTPNTKQTKQHLNYCIQCTHRWCAHNHSDVLNSTRCLWLDYTRRRRRRLRMWWSHNSTSNHFPRKFHWLWAYKWSPDFRPSLHLFILFNRRISHVRFVREKNSRFLLHGGCSCFGFFSPLAVCQSHSIDSFSKSKLFNTKSNDS